MSKRGGQLDRIISIGGYDCVAFIVDDGSFAIIHPTWTTHPSPAHGQPVSGSADTSPFRH
jgi:hypothetical protein